tara:strand:+ start:151 stop:429 length:279 start_codon:yes stop_codon:yes gene_type:complete
MGGLDGVSGFINSNKRNVEIVLTALIVVSLMPDDIMGFNLKAQLRPVVDPVMSVMRNGIVQLIIFVLLIFSCCVKVDMNMFLLLAVFLLCCK